MVAEAPVAPAAPPPTTTDDRERVSLARLLWVAPLTAIVAVALNQGVKLAAQAIDPSTARMGQLGPALITLTLEGVIGATIVFALLALVVRRPITWFRRIAVVVLVVSLLPDLGLGLGGEYARLGQRAMGPFLSVEIPGLGGPRSGPPSGGRLNGAPGANAQAGAGQAGQGAPPSATRDGGQAATDATNGARPASGATNDAQTASGTATDGQPGGGARAGRGQAGPGGAGGGQGGQFGQGGGQGGPRAGFVFPATPPLHVAILMLLHVLTAAVSVVMLTTLTRRRAASPGAG